MTAMTKTETSKLTAFASGFHKEQNFSKSPEIEETDHLSSLSTAIKGCALISTFLQSIFIIFLCYKKKALFEKLKAYICDRTFSSGSRCCLYSDRGRFSGIESSLF